MALCPTCQTNRGPWDEICGKCGFSFKELDAQKSAAASKAAEVGAGCPSCGAARPAGEESCSGCGVVYAKWKPREQRSAAAAAPAAVAQLGDDPNKTRPGCLTWMMAASILLNGSAAVLLSVITVPGVAAGPLVFISAVTAVCAFGVLRWKRWGVYGIYLVQVLSIIYLIFQTPSIQAAQPVVVVGLFHYFVSPIWHKFD